MRVFAGEVRDQKRREAQALAEALLDAETRIGELTRDIPATRGPSAEKHDNTVGFSTRTDAIARLGLQPKQVERFETLAAHPDVVAQVKADAPYPRPARLPFSAPTTASPAATKTKITPSSQ